MSQVPQNEIIGRLTAHVRQSQALLDKQAQVEDAVASRAPAVVDKLIKAGYLTADKRAVAVANARDPLMVLQSLSEVLDNIIKQGSLSVGRPASPDQSVASKQAGDQDPHMVDQSLAYVRSQADVDLLRRFGFHVPDFAGGSPGR